MCDILLRGCEGTRVKSLQVQLRREDLDLKIDGDFGAATELAVKIYQAGQGIKPDGIVGPITSAQFADSG